MVRKSWVAILATALSAATVVALPADIASGTEIKVLYVGSLRSSLRELIPSFEKSSGDSVKAEAGAAGEMVGRIQKGEAVDVAIVTTAQIVKLAAEGKVASGTQVDIASSGMGLGTRKGTAKADIGSLDTFKQTLRSSKSIGHTDPASGASSAIYAAQLLGRLDSAGELKPKIKLFASNELLFKAIAKGDVDLGFGQMSEIVAAPGVDLVGPLPSSVQNYSHYSAAIPTSAQEPNAGKAFISFLNSPDAVAVMKAKGIDHP
jgi:molybdate transport system substrate-binding protein